MNRTDPQALSESYPFLQITKRSAIVALAIGISLTFVNQWEAIFADAPLQLLPMGLVFITPFITVSISQIWGVRAARTILQQGKPRIPTLVTALFSHGIPVRAVLLGGVMGSLNTAIVLLGTLPENQQLAQLPTPLILQAITLPIIFGALSQALSLRRTILHSGG